MPGVRAERRAGSRPALPPGPPGRHEPGLPAVPGVLTRDDLGASAASILRAQRLSGTIPWYPGGDVDCWDHVESAMALSAAGEWRAAEGAYAWLAAAQRPDGSWPRRVRPGARTGTVLDPAADANHCAYVAAGVWHHTCCTGDVAFATRMWPVVRRAVQFVLALQVSGGQVRWARDGRGWAVPGALLAGCSSITHSLRCAVALADLVGHPQPGWGRAADRLATAVAHHPSAFEDRYRYSMDWYYPVLAGVVRGETAAARLEARWHEFVVPGLGVRCVADRPWVTGAETCELALTLDAIGERAAALRLLADVQHLRDRDGAYWTGYVFADGVYWPVERSTWTAAAVILAADSLSGASGGAGIFRPDGRAEWTELEPPAPAQRTGSHSRPTRASIRSEPTARTSVKAPQASARR